MSVAYPLRLYVDAACPLCRAEMRGLAARDADGRLEMVDCSGEDFRDYDAELAGFDRGQLMHRIHARDAQGCWLVGVPVFAAAYEAVGMPGVARLLRLPRMQDAWAGLYGGVADRRRLLVALGLPRLLSWCLAPRRR